MSQSHRPSRGRACDRRSSSVLSLAIALGLAGAAWGQATPAASPAATGTEAAPASTTPEHALSISLAPYLWAPSFSGSVGIRSVNIDVDRSFLDIVRDADTVFGLMGALDVTYERFVCQFNGTWMTARFDGDTAVAAGETIAATLKLDTTWLEAFAGYRFIDQPLHESAADGGRFYLDGFVGTRITIMDVETTLTAPNGLTLPDGLVLPPGESRRVDESQVWAEPFLGARMGVDFTRNFGLVLRGDIGGFGAGSDLAWQAIGMVGYRWFMDDWTLTLFGGYRALSQDYSNDGFKWDVITHGPMLGASFTF